MSVAAKVDSLARLRCRVTRTRTAVGRRVAAGLPVAAIACATLAVSGGAAFSDACKPGRPKPPIILRDMGRCNFDPSSLSFHGDPTEQAKCLMRGMDATRNLGPMLTTLPAALASRIGRDTGLPTREALSAFLSKQNLEWDFAAHLWQPLSRANDNDPNAPMARYFVIHDTSGPSFGRRPFPYDLDVNAKINNLANFKCPDGWGKAHVVVNRLGAMLLNHELSVPWRETKFERAVNFDGALKGLFIHVEMIQPRRSAGRRRHNDAQTPVPSFTAAQYQRLALLYVIASVRAGHWLVPAFHAAIDADIRNGHDDPLNFDIARFADGLDGLMRRLQEPAAADAALSASAETTGSAARSSDLPATGTFEKRASTPDPAAEPGVTSATIGEEATPK